MQTAALPNRFLSFVLVLLALGGVLKLKDFLLVPQPQFVPRLSGTELTEKLRTAKAPVFVFFYHSSHGAAARTFFPVIDQLANRFDNRIHFCRYQLSAKYPDPFFNDVWQYDSVFVLFKDGAEVKRLPAPITSLANANLGYAFLMIKDLIGYWKSPSPGNAIPPVQYVHAGNFQEAVLNSKNFVIVNFTSPTCPAAENFKPDFKRIAVANQNFAEFYLCDVTLPQNREIRLQAGSSATPTVALFFDGGRRAQFSGGFTDFQANEAAILGLLVPYL